MNIKQEVRELLVKEPDRGVASMSINRCHKHGLSIDTMLDDLKPTEIVPEIENLEL